MYIDAYKTYQSANVTTLEGAELTARLLIKAVEHLHKAIKAIEEEDISTKFNECEKARFILVSLQDSLDHESQIEDVRNLVSVLNQFYIRNAQFIAHVCTKNNIQLAQSVIANLQNTADTYKKIHLGNQNKSQDEMNTRTASKSSITTSSSLPEASNSSFEISL